MENASKALIIAAAVLITILLISLAMFLIKSGTESVDSSESSMTELEVYSFNQKFTLYEGTRKSGSQIIQLLKTVISSNSLNDNKIAVKLSGLGPVCDSCKYIIYDNATNNMLKCNSSNIVSLEEMISNVNIHKSSSYTVELYYCNKKSQSIANNKDLNPIINCVLLIHITKN